MHGTFQQSPFSRRYLIVNEVLNAVTHGIGFVLSVVGLIFLLIKANTVGQTIAYTIYGITLMILYLSSTLFHSLIFTRAKHVFQVFDHCSIYLLIAGSYTPYCLIALHNTLGYVLCAVIWTLAIFGVIFKSIAGNKLNHLTTVIYVLMGWGCLVAMKPLYQHLGPIGFWLLVAGGVAFTLGAVLYSFPRIKFIHVIWHLFVLLGTGFMYFSILLFV
ncbi:hemolysin III [Loigolactobacillus backii]|uniref:PAQR family membrane homeostasis protein TrhA n=1 Tax=Loigolactobacillus backii TaxID=375175 RepID=UPI0007F07EEA|nr:hemolysin III family protein [Loigolactobacillus backii]ANK59471.1 hemolysin III [Loigolactobacillus backii]ANK64464.1 hemolysin III [Loigolactobacillus backii]ANK67140.1 hemolysin III [Loigolactobacillus backii]OLF69989.1 hemolysin III [Loigolactobacillus backii]PIO83380.1 hemolysin III [Loigolactobacillus backii]